VINNHHHEYNNNVLSLKTLLPLHPHFQVHIVKKKVLWLLSVPDVDDIESWPSGDHNDTRQCHVYSEMWLYQMNVFMRQPFLSEIGLPQNHINIMYMILGWVKTAHKYLIKLNSIDLLRNKFHI